jgi:hypothetical protein
MATMLSAHESWRSWGCFWVVQRVLLSVWALSACPAAQECLWQPGGLDFSQLVTPAGTVVQGTPGPPPADSWGTFTFNPCLTSEAGQVTCTNNQASLCCWNDAVSGSFFSCGAPSILLSSMAEPSLRVSAASSRAALGIHNPNGCRCCCRRLAEPLHHRALRPGLCRCDRALRGKHLSRHGAAADIDRFPL